MGLLARLIGDITFWLITGLQSGDIAFLARLSPVETPAEKVLGLFQEQVFPLGDCTYLNLSVMIWHTF